MTFGKRKDVKVLLLEDDLLERIRFVKTIEQLDIQIEFDIVGEGKAAMSHLEESENLPDIILMDLYMPGQNGIEFLKEIKTNSNFNFIPTIAFTTSNKPQDISACYALGIASYILKPYSPTQYKNTVNQIFKYWKTIVQFK